MPLIRLSCNPMKKPPTKSLKRLFARANRGILLDIGMFIFGIFLMRVVTKNFIGLTRAPGDDVWAKTAIALFYTGLLILSPLGAVLKREQFWERISRQDKEEQVKRNIDWFIFSPWFSFVWLWIIYALVVAYWYQVFLPDPFDGMQWIVLVLFFGGMLYCFVGAYAISKFYEDGLGKPFWVLHKQGTTADDFFGFLDYPFFDRFRTFLEKPISAVLGDFCIYLNMILFQIFWNYLFSHFYGEGVHKDGDVLSAVLVYLLLLCLFYFPPRNFYLAEDIHRPIVWLTILLANLPSLLYFFFRIRLF
jgi:hypothetical protein